jgi:hypothetical protein
MGTFLPDEKEGAPLTTALVIENVDRDMAGVMRGLTPAARVSLSVVLASHPDEVIRSVVDMKIVNRRYDANNVTIDLTRQAAAPGSSDATEPWPAGRQTKSRSPGLHR